MKVVLAIILVLLIGCSGAAQAQDAQVDALLQRVEALEAKLEALQWTEQDAMGLVQWKLSEDPVRLLKVSRGRQIPGINLDLSGGYARTLLQAGQWSAHYEPASFGWRVEGVIPSDPPERFVFYAYQKTGLVEGVGRQ